MGGQLGSAILGIAHFSLLSRFLTQAEMGTYFLLFSITMLFSILGSLGLPDTQVRLLSQFIGAGDSSKAKAVVNRCLLFVSLSSATIAALVAIGLQTNTVTDFFNLPRETAISTIVPLWIIASCFQSIACENFRGLHDIKYATLFNNTGKNGFSLAVSLIAILLFSDFTLETALYSSLIALVINNFFAFFILKPKLQKLGTPSRITNNEIFKIALPLCANIVLIFSLTRFGIWVLGALSTAEDLALYGAALQLVTLLTLPLLIVNSVVPPIISNQYFNSNNHSKLEKTIRSFSTLAGLPAMIAVSVIYFFGAYILALVYGDNYAQAHELLIFLALGQAVNVLVGTSGTLLKMTNHHNLLLRINLFFGFFSAIFLIFAAKEFGAVGVATVTGITMIIKNVFTWQLATLRTGVNSAVFIRPSDFTHLWHSMLTLLKSRNI